MKQFYTIGLLIISNVFMTLAWYGHLKFAEWKWSAKLGLLSVILISWGVAFFEYCFQVPANKIGFTGSDYLGGLYRIYLISFQNRDLPNQSSHWVFIFGPCGIFYI